MTNILNPLGIGVNFASYKNSIPQDPTFSFQCNTILTGTTFGPFPARKAHTHDFEQLTFTLNDTNGDAQKFVALSCKSIFLRQLRCASTAKDANCHIILKGNSQLFIIVKKSVRQLSDIIVIFEAPQHSPPADANNIQSIKFSKRDEHATMAASPHTFTKQFECANCELSFTNPDTLTRHRSFYCKKGTNLKTNFSSIFDLLLSSSRFPTTKKCKDEVDDARAFDAETQKLLVNLQAHLKAAQKTNLFDAESSVLMLPIAYHDYDIDPTVLKVVGRPHIVIPVAVHRSKFSQRLFLDQQQQQKITETSHQKAQQNDENIKQMTNSLMSAAAIPLFSKFNKEVVQANPLYMNVESFYNSRVDCQKKIANSIGNCRQSPMSDQNSSCAASTSSSCSCSRSSSSSVSDGASSRTSINEDVCEPLDLRTIKRKFSSDCKQENLYYNSCKKELILNKSISINNLLNDDYMTPMKKNRNSSTSFQPTRQQFSADNLRIIPIYTTAPSDIDADHKDEILNVVDDSHVESDARVAVDVAKIVCDCGVSFLVRETYYGHKKYYCKNRVNSVEENCENETNNERRTAAKKDETIVASPNSHIKDAISDVRPSLQLHSVRNMRASRSTTTTTSAVVSPQGRCCFICELCGYKGYSERGIRSHLRSSHEKDIPSAVKKVTK